MPSLPGRRLPLSLPRRIISDFLRVARTVPTVPVQRTFRLADVVEARQAASPRPSWCAIFTKAYSLLCRDRPVLRCCYRTFPWPHLYEHPEPVASVAVERSYLGEPAVFFAQLPHPHQKPLAEIDARLRLIKEAPVESLSAIRRQLRFARLPAQLRRLLWWLMMQVWGRKRAHYAGTYGVTVYSGLGAGSLHPLSILTTTLTYDVLQPDGSLDVRLIYDHRVMDGSTIARALADLESIVRREILAELRSLRPAEAA
jgi:hypothetical protein